MNRMTSGINSIAELTRKGAADMGLPIAEKTAAAFDKYYQLLTSYGKHVNLTAIKDADEVVRCHFLDSLSLLNTADLTGATLIDIGSGAGFPGVPMKLADDTIELTLLDATQKRIKFLEILCEELEIKAQCIHARAEEAAHGEKRESYDIAVSRAVAHLNVLCELSLPFVKTGGVFLAMKGDDIEAELETARNIIKVLGAQIEAVKEYNILGTDIVRRIVIIRKICATPCEYPRRFSKIKKQGKRTPD